MHLSELRAHTWFLAFIFAMVTISAASNMVVAYFVIRAAMAVNELGQRLSEIPGLSG